MDCRVAVATSNDIAAYVAFAREAQAFLESKNLAQWVPAAHASFAPELDAMIAAETLHKVTIAGDPVAFFDLSLSSRWWRDDASAAYVSGIVVARAHRGLALGPFILDWCRSTAIAAGAEVLRLDCHAGNGWLCAYYHDYGFEEVHRIQQHPGYAGILFELQLGTRTGSDVRA
jgi:GNAT superfamily N-acetyltransferase